MYQSLQVLRHILSFDMNCNMGPKKEDSMDLLARCSIYGGK